MVFGLFLEGTASTRPRSMWFSLSVPGKRVCVKFVLEKKMLAAEARPRAGERRKGLGVELALTRGE